MDKGDKIIDRKNQISGMLVFHLRWNSLCFAFLDNKHNNYPFGRVIPVLTSFLYQVASLRSSLSSFQEQAICKVKVSKVFVPYKLCQSFNLQMSLSFPLKMSPSVEKWLLLSSGEYQHCVPFRTLCLKKRFTEYLNVLLSQTSVTDSVCVDSSETTTNRAKVLADKIGSGHLNVSIDEVVSSLISLFQTLTGKHPGYKIESSADINPIRSISKMDLRKLVKWAAIHLGYSSLAGIKAAPSTAELEPIHSNYSQPEKVDMGMTYDELSVWKAAKDFSLWTRINV
ncbi:hypothetical protein RND71_010339 [Anisodus tanguticus]|uniref:Uncharacterized protein n=1 Tax=Anisodus tanguticus TaxID=243964 RepID=A0AAE1SJM2_9SOLA|nr:hypothetical protein RND71_010339 [Anisodus tanguticus]